MAVLLLAPPPAVVVGGTGGVVDNEVAPFSVYAGIKEGESITYLWPLSSEFISGNETLAVDPDLSISLSGSGASSVIVREAFERYKALIFKHVGGSKLGGTSNSHYDVGKVTVIVRIMMKR
ncbi:hypothetical protein L1987_12403 [Smallanthus sonchifolius]|uniref:Uncharacterized protein n=1 Tax=Smallanthus sonchifolius TaxID=185202 RepID=A0ACB9JFU5_9ASTR|nr:hypothetical protein L1987_12403 [Smallanthus sonchifolius]